MKKQVFNLHTHTERCGHAEGSDRQYVLSAIEAGIKQLGFSDHIPYVEMRRADCRMFFEHKNEYLKSIRELKEEFKNEIDIMVGYEVEYLDTHVDYLKQMKKECDYFILGQHCMFLGHEYDSYCSDVDVLMYASQIEKALTTNMITYIAHPDYYMMGRRFYSQACVDVAHRIAKASKYYDIPLEINLNGFRYGKKTYGFYYKKDCYEERYVYPFREFWQIVSFYGCKVVYGYDAHSPIAFQEKDRMDKANEILKDIPLNFVDSISLR